MSSRIDAVVLASLGAVVAGGVMWAVAADAGPASACAADVPAKLAAPDGQELAFELRAEGVQVYACAPPAGSSGAPAWTLQAPEATLTDAGGRRAGTHRAGPTWEAADGSLVVGAKVEAASPDPSAIPWLLLRAASHEGSGRMAEVTWVQRVRTSGGLAPAEGCSAATAGAVTRVPYRATYCFYRGRDARSHAANTAAERPDGGPRR